MAVFTVGTPRLVNHDCYYGRLSGVFPNRLSAPETSEGFWNSWHFYFEWRSKDDVICRQKCNYQRNGNGNLICGYTAGLFLLSALLFTLLNIFHLLFPRFLPPCLYSLLHCLFFFSVLIPDYKGLPASDAGAAARPCSMYKLHPVPVSHPWGHRLLHLQGFIAGLYGESDAGPAGLSRRWLHHRASLPHQYRDVPGNESQVFIDALCY